MNKPNAFPIDQIDLCAGEVRVTAQGLKRLAEIAAFRSRCECERLLHSIQETGLNGEIPCSAYLDAERLQYVAESLAMSFKFSKAFQSLEKGERIELNVYTQKKN